MSDSSPLQSPAEAAVQLRTAYRLLNAYHRRLLDLLSMTRDAVADKFGDLPKAWWAPWYFWMPPKGSTDPTSRWPFDFICLQEAYFNWASSDAPMRGAFFFGFTHTADSGLDKKVYGDNEPDPLNLPDVAAARTSMDVWAVAVERCAVQSWPDLAAKHFADEQVGKIPDTFWSDRRAHKLDAEGDTLHFGGFGLDITEIWTEEQVKTNLIKPLLDLITEVRGAVPPTAGRGRAKHT